MSLVKICKGCKIEYDKNIFGKDIRKPDGLRLYCPNCIKERNKIYYQKTKDKRHEDYTIKQDQKKKEKIYKLVEG